MKSCGPKCKNFNLKSHGHVLGLCAKLMIIWTIPHESVVSPCDILRPCVYMLPNIQGSTQPRHNPLCDTRSCVKSCMERNKSLNALIKPTIKWTHNAHLSNTKAYLNITFHAKNTTHNSPTCLSRQDNDFCTNKLRFFIFNRNFLPV